MLLLTLIKAQPGRPGTRFAVKLPDGQTGLIELATKNPHIRAQIALSFPRDYRIERQSIDPPITSDGGPTRQDYPYSTDRLDP